MSALAKIALFFALLSSISPAFAQDALGGGASIDDDWEAILKLAPPPSVAASDTKRSKSARAETSGSAREQNGETRGSGREPSNEARLDARGSAREQNNEAKQERTREREGGREASTRSESKKSAEPAEARAGGERSESKKAKSERVEQEASARGPGEEQAQLPKSGAEGAQGNYAGLVRQWHDPWPAHAGDQAIDKIVGAAPALSIHPDGKAGTPYVLLPNGKDGGFNEEQITVASQAFGNWTGGPRVSARLLDLIYHAAQHFSVFHVYLVSGIRNDRSGSRHSHGLAADIVLPGVSDDELAAYFRPQGFLGVGVYTRGGFVHVDVRERSYFWLDRSPPGRRMKIIPERADEARLADEAAILRGQVGYVNPPRLQKALHARARHRMEKARGSQ